jgi:cation diffusion facilitator family transporter
VDSRIRSARLAVAWAAQTVDIVVASSGCFGALRSTLSDRLAALGRCSGGGRGRLAIGGGLGVEVVPSGADPRLADRLAVALTLIITRATGTDMGVDQHPRPRPAITEPLTASERRCASTLWGVRSTEQREASQGRRAADELDAQGQLRTALASVFAAGALVVLKLGTGLVAGSLGLVSAGIESSGDVVAAVLTVFAIRLGGRPADTNHPYGHRRAENLAALGEAAILVGGGVVVVVAAIGRLTGGGEPFEAHWYVFAVIAVALAVDVSRVFVSLRGAALYKSAALRSNAFHFAGDLAGSLAVLAGLVAVSAGFEQGDAVAALVVAAIIFSAAARLIVENARVLMDTTPAEAHARAHAAISDLGDDIDLRRLRVRESGGHYFADAVVAVPPGQAAVEGQGIADHIEAAVRRALPDIDVVVHLEPRREGLSLRDVVLATALAEPLVRDVHDISIYRHGERNSVSLHLKLEPDVPLAAAHEVAERVEATLRAQPGVDDVHTHLEPLERPLVARDESGASDETERQRITRLVIDRTGVEPRELRLLHTDRGLVVFVSVVAGPDTALPDAHELASRLEDNIREAQPQIADVVVHTEPWPSRQL